MISLLFLIIVFIEQTLSVYQVNVEPSNEIRNVLVLVADDLGLELNNYGNHVIKTPNILALSSRGVTYDNA